MNVWGWFMISLVCVSSVLLSGCSDDVIVLPTNTVSTVNGTVYDPSRSFELVSFCSSASFDSNPNSSLLNCSIGNITDLSFSNSSGNWSCMSCAFDISKCSTSTISNITLYAGLNLSAEHIISSDFNGQFSVLCCNNAGSQCYRPVLLSSNGTYASCGAGYQELIGSLSFNNVSNKWSVTSCLNGFK